jgi:6-pyruvoyltetrahydropterin/6-carboxytetrahydropterin synthase
MKDEISITREFGFDMGHCLPDHEGGCYRPHGHRYRLEVELAGKIHDSGPANGMVVDFGTVKQVVTAEVIDRLDHRFMIARDDPRWPDMDKAFGGPAGGVIPCDLPPTAETLAGIIGVWLQDVGLNVTRITLWETPTCRAEWKP